MLDALEMTVRLPGDSSQAEESELKGTAEAVEICLFLSPGAAVIVTVDVCAVTVTVGSVMVWIVV